MKDNNKILDWWSLGHIGSGLYLGMINIPRYSAYGLLIGFEILENVIFREELGDFFGDFEAPTNMISDVILGIGGYELTRHIKDGHRKHKKV